MENNRLVALQEKRDELKKEIKEKQKEADCFDVSEYYDAEMFLDGMREEYGAVDIMGYEYNAISALYELAYFVYKTCLV